jgi:hypothetical protein
MRPFVRVAQSLPGASTIGPRSEGAASASKKLKALSPARKFLQYVEARRKVHHMYYVLAALDLAASKLGEGTAITAWFAVVQRERKAA